MKATVRSHSSGRPAAVKVPGVQDGNRTKSKYWRDNPAARARAAIQARRGFLAARVQTSIPRSRKRGFEPDFALLALLYGTGHRPPAGLRRAMAIAAVQRPSEWRKIRREGEFLNGLLISWG